MTNKGLVAGIAPNAERTQFLDSIVEKVKQLVRQNKDTPKDDSLQQMCDAMQHGKW